MPATPRPPAPLPNGTVILGIDPGLADMGWGAAIIAPDGKLYHKAHGVCRTQAVHPMPTRVDMQSEELLRLIATYRPNVLAVEAWVYYSHVKQGAGTNTMRVCGAIRALGRALCTPVVEYTAQAVKGIVLDQRNAEKMDVQRAVQAFFGLEKLPRPSHAADALACAIAHYRAQAPPGDVVSRSVGLRKVV
jgi:crossover junction endodeoxyribonuclease RuvC